MEREQGMGLNLNRLRYSYRFLGFELFFLVFVFHLLDLIFLIFCCFEFFFCFYCFLLLLLHTGLDFLGVRQRLGRRHSRVFWVSAELFVNNEFGLT